MKHYYTVEIENKRSGSLRRVTIIMVKEYF